MLNCEKKYFYSNTSFFYAPVDISNLKAHAHIIKKFVIKTARKIK